ncbi:MAG TPA: hypothetical protein VNL38_02870 [Candidatus Nitrosotenuis sp.]|nr:hypothetical protein [Candidatus Nitrosotenuis sp.]
MSTLLESAFFKGKAKPQLLFVVLFLFIFAEGAIAQRGAKTLPRNIAQLAEQSERIVRGRVTRAVVERDPNQKTMWTIVITLRVEETLKGPAVETLTLRQFIWDVRDRMDAAGYQKGQHVLLLLNRPTPLGLVSPAGLDQGRFLIRRNAKGEEEVFNAAGNSGLLRGLDSELRRRGTRLSPQLAQKISSPSAQALDLREMRELLRAFVEPK